MTDTEINKVIEINASIEKIFNSISDENEITKWFPDEAILEPKVGGTIKISFLKDSEKPKMKMEKDFINEGRILEIIPNKKFVHTWQWKEFSDFPETIVTWELMPEDNNKTKLTLTHAGFTGKEEGPASLEEHSKGCPSFLMS